MLANAEVAPVEQVVPVETKRTYPPQNFLRSALAASDCMQPFPSPSTLLALLPMFLGSSEHQQAVLTPGLSLASFWQTGKALQSTQGRETGRRISSTGGPNVSVDAAPAAPPAAATAPAKPAAAHGIDFTRSTSPDLAEAGFGQRLTARVRKNIIVVAGQVSISDPFRAAASTFPATALQ